MTSSAPTIAIVGRTNVGKSTLFNKLIEEQKSLVSEVPGTTRDWFEGDCIWRAKVVRFVDTGGLDKRTGDAIDVQISKQAHAAIKRADLVVFVVDAQTGLQEEDRILAKELHKHKKPIILVANKADNPRLIQSVNDAAWHKWSLGTPLAVSAKRGTGTGDLLDRVFDELKTLRKEPLPVSDMTATRVAVIGRPNVGKSSLLNAALGETRFIASGIEHTTREPNDTLVTVEGRDYLLIDTAGIRRMARIHKTKSKLEEEGVARTLRAIKRADVCLLVLDISQAIQAQDKHLAGELEKSGASVIIIANKWDLIPDKDPVTIDKYERYIRAHLPFLDWAPILFTSASTGKRVQQLFEVIDQVFENRFTQLNDKESHEFISRAIVKHKPSRGKGVAHPTIWRFRQTRVNPPEFLLFIKQERTDALNSSYLRFLENLLRKFYSFDGTPIHIKVRGRKKSHTT